MADVVADSRRRRTAEPVQVVAEVHAGDSGVLRVRFASGWRLDVPVDLSGPGWIVGLGGRCFLSSAAGGGVRISAPGKA
ncbi:DUF6188 family protein [Streptomyces sp. NPDC091265]|uniref:DUF6188 family protein n=1 Tax=Streptomyces sp. NPDC091265 TaxID=3365977 RepID=UPI00380B9FF2